MSLNPFKYDTLIHTHASIAAGEAFGAGVELVYPPCPEERPGGQDRPSVEDWVDDSRRKLGVDYKNYGYMALAGAISALFEDQPGDYARTGASLRITLPPVITTAGELPAKIALFDIDSVTLAKAVGNRLHDLPPVTDRTKIVYPGNFVVATEIGDPDSAVRSKSPQLFNRTSIGQYSSPDGWRSETGFVLPVNGSSEIVDLPARGYRHKEVPTRSEREATYYTDVVCLAHVALMYVQEHGSAGVIIGPGAVRNFNDLLQERGVSVG